MPLAYQAAEAKTKKSRKGSPGVGAPLTADLPQRSTVGLGNAADAAPRVTEALVLPQRLHQFFEQQCDARPEAVALIVGDEQYSYAALDARANQLARHLAGLGIGPQDRVGILLERSVPTYVTLLAVLKCGAAFVPIDPSFPPERIAYIAADAALNLLVTTTGFARVTNSPPAPTILSTAGTVSVP